MFKGDPMTVRLTALIAVLAAALCLPVQAATVRLDLTGGTVDRIGNRVASSAVPGFADFQIGETVRTTLTFRDDLIDSDDRANRGRFADPLATLRFTGLTSGASVAFDQTLTIATRGTRLVFDTPNPDATKPVGLTGAFTLLSDIAIFSNPNSLQTTLADLTGGGFTDISTGSVNIAFWDAGRERSARALRFNEGIDAAQLSPVPVPAPIGLALLGVTALAGLRLRRQRAG